MNQDEKYIRKCLELAKNAQGKGNEPFGAILVKDDEVVLTSENGIFTYSDPTHHAELALIREYCQTHKTMDLSDLTLYTSCEPCFMCSGSMVWSKLGRLVYSAGSNDLNKILNQKEFSTSDVVFSMSHRKPQVMKFILREEGIEILEAYFG